jgi:elongator complex protein 3
MTSDIEGLVFKEINTIPDDVLDKAFPYFEKFYNHIISENTTDKLNIPLLIQKNISKPMKRQFRKTQLISMYRHYLSKDMIQKNKTFENLIKAKATRSSSGIVNITFVFKPDKGSCEMDCDYCPNDPNVTRSYRLDEPAVARAYQVLWDPVEQFNSRVNTLHNLGHDITKLEYIIEGGTFHSYSQDYVIEFIRDCYYAANVYLKPNRPRLSIEEEIKINETSDCPVIGLTIETRPDMIIKKQIELFRRLGVTRVQMGVQSIFDEILRNVNRKCPTHKTIKGLYLLKQNCFKVDLHWMPDLPGSTYEIDLLMFKWICGEKIADKDIDDVSRKIIGEQGVKILTSNNDILQGDQFKIYPTMVLPYTKIKDWYFRAKKEGVTETNVNTSEEKKMYVPYAEKENGIYIDKLMTYILTNCPKQIRINRVVRDFTKGDIMGGTDRLDLRHEISTQITNIGLLQTDIRSREVRSGKIDIPKSKIWINKYRSSEGTEYFISLENECQTTLYGFIRLRINDNWENVFFDEIKNCAYVRELHVYGNVVPIGSSQTGVSQHLGIGKFLLYIAEQIALQNKFKKIAIIAGVGTREYYKKFGYKYDNTFMIKEMNYTNYIICPDLWKDKIPVEFQTNKKYKKEILLLCLIIAFYMFKSLYL